MMKDPEDSLEKTIVKRLEDIGSAREKLDLALRNELFNDLSKHNREFHHIDPDIADKLDDIRRKLISVEEYLNDAYAILRWHEDER